MSQDLTQPSSIASGLAAASATATVTFAIVAAGPPTIAGVVATAGLFAAAGAGRVAHP